MAETPIPAGGLNAKGRVEGAETPAAAAQAGVPPTPGGEPEVPEEIPEVFISLEELYDTVGFPPTAAWETLKAILEKWSLDHVILYNVSPDAGIEYFDPEFERIAEKYEEGDEDDWLTSAVRDYARRKGARAIVTYYDGYEEAAAVILNDC